MLKKYQIAWLCFIANGLLLVAIFAYCDCIGFAIVIGILDFIYTYLTWDEIWTQLKIHEVTVVNPYNQKTLEILANQVSENNQNIYFYPKCHSEAGLEIFYSKQSGILSACCRECTQTIFEFIIEKEK